MSEKPQQVHKAKRGNAASWAEQDFTFQRFRRLWRIPEVHPVTKYVDEPLELLAFPVGGGLYLLGHSFFQ